MHQRIMKKPYADEAFLLGLLHDLGKLVLVRQIPEEYKKVIDLTQKGRQYAEVEQEKLGFSHPLIGALVARKWNFSPETCQVILHHHDPIEPPLESDVEEKTGIVILANYISHQMGYGHLEGYPDLEEPRNKLAEILGLTEDKLQGIREATQIAFDEQSQLFL